MSVDPALLLAVVLGAIAVVAYFVFASFAFGAGYQPTPRRAVAAMLRMAVDNVLAILAGERPAGIVNEPVPKSGVVK